jgi:hypothetical protein
MDAEGRGGGRNRFCTNVYSFESGSGRYPISECGVSVRSSESEERRDQGWAVSTSFGDHGLRRRV